VDEEELGRLNDLGFFAEFVADFSKIPAFLKYAGKSTIVLSGPESRFFSERKLSA
jgi:hypothetical protein